MEDIVEQEARKKKAQIIALLITAVFVVAGIIMWKNSDSFLDYDHTLALSAKAVNLTCPQMVDDDTRLDSVTTEPGRNYLYHFTAITLDSTELDIDLTCNIMRSTILENMHNNADVAAFGKNDVTIVFNFRDKNGLELCSIRLLPEEYLPEKNVAPDTVKNSTP